MPISGKTWEPALERARPVLRMLARQRLPRWVWRRVDPSDVVQITLAEANERRADFRGGSEAELLGWLHPMLIHRMLDKIRQCRAKGQDMRREEDLDNTARRLKEELAATSAKTPSQVLLKREILDLLSRALDKLPADQRLVVESHHLMGFTLAEIASSMSPRRSVWAVGRLLRQGLARLFRTMKGAV